MTNERCQRHGKIKKPVRLRHFDTRAYLVIIQFAFPDYYHYKCDRVKLSIEWVICSTELKRSSTMKEKKKRTQRKWLALFPFFLPSCVRRLSSELFSYTCRRKQRHTHIHSFLSQTSSMQSARYSKWAFSLWFDNCVPLHAHPFTLSIPILGRTTTGTPLLLKTTTRLRNGSTTIIRLCQFCRLFRCNGTD